MLVRAPDGRRWRVRRVRMALALRRPATVEAVPLDDPGDVRSRQVAGYGAGRRAARARADRVRSGGEPDLPT